MNKIVQRIGIEYPCVIRRKRRGFYTVEFTMFNFDLTMSKIHMYNPKYHAEVVRTSGHPKEWHINIKNMDGHVIRHAAEFTGLIETCKYARFWLMELEGVSNEKETM